MFLAAKLQRKFAARCSQFRPLLLQKHSICQQKHTLRFPTVPFSASLQRAKPTHVKSATNRDYCVSNAEKRLRNSIIQQVRIDDPSCSPRVQLWRQVTLQDCFEKFDHDGAFTNFDRVRDGQSGNHGGFPRYDAEIRVSSFSFPKLR